MAATITKGYTFGATELVTNTKLHTLVDNATIDLTAPGTIGSATSTITQLRVLLIALE